jgi:carbon storage regulator
MLVLSRKVGESIVIGEDILVKIIEINGKRVRLGLEAPTNIAIRRAEAMPPQEEFPESAAG